MRCTLGIRYLLCFFCMIASSYSSDSSVAARSSSQDPKKTTTPSVQPHKSISLKAQSTKTNALDAWHIFPLDLKNFFFTAAPVYGSLSDGGASATGYAEIALPSGDTQNYIPKVGVNWGFQASLGYALADDYRYAFITSFFSLNGSRVTSVGMQNNSTLFNELTQLGTIGDPDNFGFSTFYGNASASATAGIKYQRLDFKLQEPWSEKDDPTDVFHFYKIKGLMLAGINKFLSGYYTGDVLIGTGGNTYPGTDSMLYGSNSYGVGPELGLLAYAHVMDRLKIRVEADSAFLIGYFNSHYREYGTSLTGPVEVGNVSAFSFSNTESHPSSSWTPIFFAVQSSADVALWKSNKTHTEIDGGAGFGIEYILPTFTGDDVSQPLGNPLLKFNNNLSISYIIMRLALTGDL